jgi:hypothetical protein
MRTKLDKAAAWYLDRLLLKGVAGFILLPIISSVKWWSENYYQGAYEPNDTPSLVAPTAPAPTPVVPAPTPVAPAPTAPAPAPSAPAPTPAAVVTSPELQAPEAPAPPSPPTIQEPDVSGLVNPSTGDLNKLSLEDVMRLGVPSPIPVPDPVIPDFAGTPTDLYSQVKEEARQKFEKERNALNEEINQGVYAETPIYSYPDPTDFNITTTGGGVALHRKLAPQQTKK